MLWHIVVVVEDGCREPTGAPSADLAAIVQRAIALADELGRVPVAGPRDCRVDVVSGDGEIELSIAVIAGGLDPNGA